MNWIELNALHTLYKGESVKKNDTLLKSNQVKFLLCTLKVLHETSKQLLPAPGFTEIYERTYLNNYLGYRDFLEKENLLKAQSRFEESDIKILIKIKSWKDAEILATLQKRIIDGEESLRGVSLMFFKNEKYLDNKPSLINALKQLLEVTEFANEKDQQYMYKLECHNPQAIVLCENLDFLTKPVKPRKYGIELWYAGGKNVTKLDYADRRGLPIYYSCDWDHDGLFVIYPLVKAKIPEITLLTPNGSPKSITETEHKSLWKSIDLASDARFFNRNHQQLLQSLRQNNQWIIEESNNLVEMVDLKE